MASTTRRHRRAIDDDLHLAALRRRLPEPAVRRALREYVGVSQRAVAHDLGVAQGVVSRWESGKREVSDTLLASYLAILRNFAREVVHRPERAGPLGEFADHD
jgi:transcriptional regulator with XRE-family HTH domain